MKSLSGSAHMPLANLYSGHSLNMNEDRAPTATCSGSGLMRWIGLKPADIGGLPRLERAALTQSEESNADEIGILQRRHKTAVRSS